MRIGILGSGLMGGKLGTIFARAGHDVVGVHAPHARIGGEQRARLPRIVGVGEPREQEAGARRAPRDLTTGVGDRARGVVARSARRDQQLVGDRERARPVRQRQPAHRSDRARRQRRRRARRTRGRWHRTIATDQAPRREGKRRRGDDTARSIEEGRHDRFVLKQVPIRDHGVPEPKPIPGSFREVAATVRQTGSGGVVA